MHKKESFNPESLNDEKEKLALSEGADLCAVSKLLRHTDIKNTRIYADVVNKLKMEAVARLAKINPEALGGAGLKAI